MKLSDFIIDFLARQGIRHNFLVSGGAVNHLVDSTARHPDMEYICVQHEQNGAAAADAYARVTGNLGLTMTTSGPGATNILTSVCSAYFDSVPLICVTGQVSRPRIKQSKTLRQKGFQETDIISTFQSITKYAKLVIDPQMIRYELEKAIYIATEGRPGPVLLDIPDDLQRETINPEELVSYIPENPVSYNPRSKIDQLVTLIRQAKKPVIIFGAGVHIAKQEEEACKFAKHFHLPILLTWGAKDLLSNDHRLNMGGVGACGPRAGNFAVQNSDLVIAIGTRLSQLITGGKQELFAPHAKKVMIDVDEEELNKFDRESFELDLSIHSDLRDVFTSLISHYDNDFEDYFHSWREQISGWKDKYPICEPSYYSQTDMVNPYVFFKEISKFCRDDEVIFTDTGATVCWTMQGFETKGNQRIISAWNNTPMGYALPASIGATLALQKRIVCIIGDGGLMMCLEELGTMKKHNLPIKIFLFNNQNHAIQKQTMDSWFKSNYNAADTKSGLFFPDYTKIADAFGIPYIRIETQNQLNDQLNSVFNIPGPMFCDVHISDTQRIIPMLQYGFKLEELNPKIPIDQLTKIMNTESVKKDKDYLNLSK